MSFKSEVWTDYTAHTKSGKKPSWLRVWIKTWTSRGFRAAFSYRIAKRFARKYTLLTLLSEGWVRLVSGADISLHAEIGEGLRIPHPGGVIIGHNVRLGRNVSVYQGVTLGGAGGKTRPDGTTQPHVGDDVFIGPGAKVLGPVDIGDRAFIGANAVVVRDVPADAMVGGVPAQVIRIKDRPVPLLDRGGQNAEILKDLLARLAAAEAELKRLSAEQGRNGD